MIYEDKHEGWYSVSDETFYPESSVQLSHDPCTGRKYMASRETGKEVEKNVRMELSLSSSEVQRSTFGVLREKSLIRLSTYQDERSGGRGLFWLTGPFNLSTSRKADLGYSSA